MEAPFDRIGPGQVGRWAYQVFGKNGPIFNPNNIRYLPSDYAQTSLPAVEPSPLSGINPATLATGLAGVNLLVSTGTLDILREAGYSWFYNSDASLIHRTWKELAALRDGYHKVFYSFLNDSDDTPTNPLEYRFECEMNGGLTEENMPAA